MDFGFAEQRGAVAPGCASGNLGLFYAVIPAKAGIQHKNN
jgi:hypothetical protein